MQPIRADLTNLAQFLSSPAPNVRTQPAQGQSAPAAGPRRPGEPEPEIAGALRAQAAARRDGLDRVDAMLRELDGLLRAAEPAARRSAADRQAAQGRIDALLADIQRTAEQSGVTGPPAARADAGYRIENLSPLVTGYRVTAKNLPPGQPIDVQVAVQEPARQAGLLLSFGAPRLDLAAPPSAFVIRIEGPRGVIDLSFASGTLIADISSTINAFAAQTGVSASRTGAGGVRLLGSGYGSDKFVGVRVLDTGGLEAGPNAGVYKDRTSGKAIGTPDPASGTAFSTAAGDVTGRGTDVKATINGRPAVGRGFTISLESAVFDAQIDLFPFPIQPGGPSGTTRGTFRAFTIVPTRSSAEPAPGPSPTADPTPADPAQDVRDALASLLARDSGGFALPGRPAAEARSIVADARRAVNAWADRPANA
ncbi:MAG: hypothetical protein IBJ11_02630 [Phycisphaerales bacterium]|nr:hypothetical protein [Phycisphaerales bacterium]